jgi:hypothetical protein
VKAQDLAILIHRELPRRVAVDVCHARGLSRSVYTVI